LWDETQGVELRVTLLLSPTRGTRSIGSLRRRGFAPQLAVATNESVGRTIVRKLESLSTLQLRDDAIGQHFSEFDPPLVERVNIPDRTLNEDLVLVERD